MRFWLKPWNAHVCLNCDKFNRSVWFVFISVFMYVFAEPCKHHYPVAYCILFKRLFWTQIFTSISLVFSRQAISISQTECHTVPHLDTFTMNSHNTVYKQHSCWVLAWWLLCCDSLCVTGEARRLHYCTKPKQFNLWYAIGNEKNIEHWNVLLTCSNHSLCETAPLIVAPPCNVPVRGHQVKFICPHILNKFLLSPINVKLLSSSILCACCIGSNSVNLVKNCDNFALKCTPCGHQWFVDTQSSSVITSWKCVITNKCCSN